MTISKMNKIKYVCKYINECKEANKLNENK